MYDTCVQALYISVHSSSVWEGLPTSWKGAVTAFICMCVGRYIADKRLKKILSKMLRGGRGGGISKFCHPANTPNTQHLQLLLLLFQKEFHPPVRPQ